MSYDNTYQAGNTDKIKKKKKKSDDTDDVSIDGYTLKLFQSFGMKNNLINNNIEFIKNNKVIFICGCNLVIYDLINKTSEFIIRKSPDFTITSMSVGYSNENESYVCLGEYNPINSKSQISVIGIEKPNTQYILTNKENQTHDWKEYIAKIIKNSYYCIGLAKKDNNHNQTKFSFWKFSQELFISEAILDEDLYDVTYNPKNSHELIICGKSYMRFWNVFIHQGIVKEHPQRYFKTKQEKEHTFIKAQFFENKSFMFAVGTLDNVIFVIEGFNIICEINALYKKENIIDLNIFGIQNTTDEEEENLDLTNNLISSKNVTKKVFSNVKENTTNEILKKNKIEESNPNLKQYAFQKDNSLKTFSLVGNNMILFAFKDDSIIYVYKLDKDLKQKKDINLNSLSVVSLKEIRENNEKEEVFVNRISKNIKQIINCTTNEDSSNIIFSVEVYNKEIGNKSDTSICLYLFNRKNTKLTFEREIFNNYSSNYNIKGFVVNEKTQMFFSINDHKYLRCVDFKYNFFLLQNKLKEEPLNITCCPNDNLIGVSFSNKYSIYIQLRDKISLFTEFDVSNSLGKFSDKGDYLAIYGENNFTKSYNIYFVDTLYLNTVHIIENFKSKIKKLSWYDNDRFIFGLFENNNIFGWNVNFDFLTVNLMNRFKDREINLETTYFKMIFKHFVKTNQYEDFEYDFKNDMIILCHKNIDKVNQLFNLNFFRLVFMVKMEEV